MVVEKICFFYEERLFDGVLYVFSLDPSVLAPLIEGKFLLKWLDFFLFFFFPFPATILGIRTYTLSLTHSWMWPTEPEPQTLTFSFFVGAQSHTRVRGLLDDSLRCLAFVFFLLSDRALMTKAFLHMHLIFFWFGINIRWIFVTSLHNV